MSRRRAFSLLELIVALGMVATLSLALYGAMRTALQARKNVFASTDANRAASLAADAVREDFESVPRPVGVYAQPFVAYHQPGAQGDEDTVEFHAIGEDQPMTDSPLAEGIRRIELLVRSDVSPPALVRRVTRNLAPSLEANVEEEILCRDVRSFSLRYFDGFTWQETWDSTTVDNALPLAVSIVVDVGDPQHPNDPPIRASRIITLSCAKPVDTSTLGGG